MTEEADSAAPAATVAPKRRGWPRGKPRTQRVAKDEPAVQAAARAPRPSLISKMKARPNWESEDFVGVGLEQASRIGIPQDVVNDLWRDGVALQWGTKSIRGKDEPQILASMERGGWTPVYQEDFDGRLDGMFMPKGNNEGPIVVDDCILLARPTDLHKKAVRAQSRDAAEPLQIAEEQIGHGIPGVTGSNHPTALRGNKLNKSLERIEIPE